MTELDTKQRLIQIIAQHYLEGGEGKLTIQTASERAGISRQAFNRYYNDLKPYVLGQQPIVELLGRTTNNLQPLLAKCQGRILELQSEVHRLNETRDSYNEEVRVGYITTLMKSDIALHNSVELGKTVEKQALHVNKLINDLQTVKMELALSKARNNASMTSDEASREAQSNVVFLDLDLSAPNRKFFKTDDVHAFENEKSELIDKSLKKAVRFCGSGYKVVFIFVDRYMCDFKKYCEFLMTQGLNNTLVIRAPLHNPTEIKMFVKKIPEETRVELHVPVCTSDAVLKAQRKFLFQGTPVIEFDAADKMALPSINQIISRIIFHRIEQGD